MPLMGAADMLLSSGCTYNTSAKQDCAGGYYIWNTIITSAFMRHVTTKAQNTHLHSNGTKRA